MEYIKEVNGDLVILLNDEDLEQLEWKEKDTIEIVPDGNGKIILEKV